MTTFCIASFAPESKHGIGGIGLNFVSRLYLHPTAAVNEVKKAAEERVQ